MKEDRNRKSYLIAFRVPMADHLKIREKAKKERKTISEYVRNLVIRKNEKKRCQK